MVKSSFQKLRLRKRILLHWPGCPSQFFRGAGVCTRTAFLEPLPRPLPLPLWFRSFFLLDWLPREMDLPLLLPLLLAEVLLARDLVFYAHKKPNPKYH